MINWEFPKRNHRDLSVSHFTVLFITTQDYIQGTSSKQTPTKSSTPDWALHHFLFQLNCLIREILSSRLPLKDNIDWFQLNLEIIRSLLPGFEYFHQWVFHKYSRKMPQIRMIGKGKSLIYCGIKTDPSQTCLRFLKGAVSLCKVPTNKWTLTAPSSN